MSTDDSAFTKLPDHVVARVLAALDIKSRLRMARACKRFSHVCFESYQPAVWWRVDIAETECRELAKYEDVLEDVSDMVESLVIENFTPGGYCYLLLDCLPAMNSLKHLKLGGSFEVDENMVGGLASRFPVAVSICAQEAGWNMSALESIRRVAFPKLNELKVSTISPNGVLFERPELNDLINALDGIQAVHVCKLSVCAAEGPGIVGNPVDRLSATRWGKNISYLTLNCSETPPQTPIAKFERLESLTVWNAEEQSVDWLKTMCAAPKLRQLDLCGCSGLDRLWGSESCFPVGVSKIQLQFCTEMDDRFISQITRNLTSLNSFTVHSLVRDRARHIKFNVSAALQVLLHADSSLEDVRFVGHVSSEHNSVNELRLVYNQFMENPGSLANLKELHLDLSMQAAEIWQRVKLKLDRDCDLEELARRLPNPETKIYFSAGRHIPASAD